jgi:hypothetical protein
MVGRDDVLKARLHPLWTGSEYRYSVILDGKLLVERSRDPECDAARALVAQGITGKLTMLDGKNGRPRTIIDIEKAAKLRTREGRCAPYFAPVETSPQASSKPETIDPVSDSREVA